MRLEPNDSRFRMGKWQVANYFRFVMRLYSKYIFCSNGKSISSLPLSDSRMLLSFICYHIGYGTLVTLLLTRSGWSRLSLWACYHLCLRTYGLANKSRGDVLPSLEQRLFRVSPKFDTLLLEMSKSIFYCFWGSIQIYRYVLLIFVKIFRPKSTSKKMKNN